MVKLRTLLSTGFLLEYANAQTSTCAAALVTLKGGGGGLAAAFEFTVACALGTGGADIGDCTNYVAQTALGTFLTETAPCVACYQTFFDDIKTNNGAIGAVCLDGGSLFDPLLLGCADVLKVHRDNFLTCGTNDVAEVEILTGLPDARCSKTNIDSLDSLFNPYYAMLIAAGEDTTSASTSQHWLPLIIAQFTDPTTLPTTTFTNYLLASGETCTTNYPCCSCFKEFENAIAANRAGVLVSCRQGAAVCADSSPSIAIATNYYCPADSTATNGCLANPDVNTALRQFEYCSGWPLRTSVPDCTAAAIPSSILTGGMSILRCLHKTNDQVGDAGLAAFNACMLDDNSVGADYYGWDCKQCFLNMIGPILTTVASGSLDLYDLATLTTLELTLATHNNIIDFNDCLGVSGTPTEMFSATTDYACLTTETFSTDMVAVFEFIMTCAREDFPPENIAACPDVDNIGSTTDAFETFILAKLLCAQCYEDFYTSVVANSEIKLTCRKDTGGDVYVFDPLATGCAELLDGLRSEFFACSGIELLSGSNSDLRCSAANIYYLDRYFTPYYAMLIAGDQDAGGATTDATWMDAIVLELSLSGSSALFKSSLLEVGGACTVGYPCCSCFAEFAAAISSSTSVSTDCDLSGTCTELPAAGVDPSDGDPYCPIDDSCLENLDVVAALRQFEYCSGWPLQTQVSVCTTIPATLVTGGMSILRCLHKADNQVGEAGLTAFNDCLMGDNLIGVAYSAWTCQGCFLDMIGTILNSHDLDRLCGADIYDPTCLAALGLGAVDDYSVVNLYACLSGVTVAPFVATATDYVCDTADITTFAADTVAVFEFIMTCAREDPPPANIAACTGVDNIGTTTNAFETFILAKLLCAQCYEDFYTSVVANSDIKSTCRKNTALSGAPVYVFDPLASGCPELLEDLRSEFFSCSGLELLSGVAEDKRCSKTSMDNIDSYFDPYYAMLKVGADGTTETTIDDWIGAMDLVFADADWTNTQRLPSSTLLDYLWVVDEQEETASCTSDYPCCSCFSDFADAVLANADNVKTTCQNGAGATSGYCVSNSPYLGYCPSNSQCLANVNVQAALVAFQYCSGWNLRLTSPSCSSAPAELGSAVPALRCIRGLGSLTDDEAATELNECLLRDPIVGEAFTAWACRGCYLNLMRNVIAAGLSDACLDDIYSFACLESTGLHDRSNPAIIEFNDCLSITNSFELITFDNARSGADYRCPDSDVFGGLVDNLFMHNVDTWAMSSASREHARKAVASAIAATEDCGICFEDYIGALAGLEIDNTGDFATLCLATPSAGGCETVNHYADLFHQCTGYSFQYSNDMCDNLDSSTVVTELEALLETPGVIGDTTYLLGILVTCANDATCEFSTLFTAGEAVYDLLSSPIAAENSCGSCFQEFVQALSDRGVDGYLGDCFADPGSPAPETFDYTLPGCLELIQFQVDRFTACHGSFDLITGAPIEQAKCTPDDEYVQTLYLPYGFIIDCVIGAATDVATTKTCVQAAITAGVGDAAYIKTYGSTFATALASIPCAACYDTFITDILAGTLATSCTAKYATACYEDNTGVAAAIANFENCSGQTMIVDAPLVCTGATANFWDISPIVFCASIPTFTDAATCLGGFTAYTTTGAGCGALFSNLVDELREFLSANPVQHSLCLSPFSDACWSAVEPVVTEKFYHKFRLQNAGARIEFTRGYNVAGCVDTAAMFYAASANVNLAEAIVECAVTDDDASAVGACLTALYAASTSQNVANCGTTCLPFLSLAIEDIFGTNFPSSGDCFNGLSAGNSICAKLFNLVESYQRCTGIAALPSSQACTNVGGALDFFASTDDPVLPALMEKFTLYPSVVTKYDLAIALAAFMTASPTSLTVNYNCKACLTAFTTALTTAKNRNGSAFSACYTLPAFDATNEGCQEVLDPFLTAFEECAGHASFIDVTYATRCLVSEFNEIHVHNDVFPALTVCAIALKDSSPSQADLLDCVDQVSGSKEIRKAITADNVNHGRCGTCYFDYMDDIIGESATSVCLESDSCLGGQDSTEDLFDDSVAFTYLGVPYYPRCPACREETVVDTALTNFETCTGGSAMPIENSLSRSCKSYQDFTDISIPWSEMIYCGKKYDNELDRLRCLHDRNMALDYMDDFDYDANNVFDYSRYDDCKRCFVDFMDTYGTTPRDFAIDTEDCHHHEDEFVQSTDVSSNLCEPSLRTRNGPESEFYVCMGYSLRSVATDTTCTDAIATGYTYILDLAHMVYDYAADEDAALVYFNAYVALGTGVDVGCGGCFKQFAMDVEKEKREGLLVHYRDSYDTENVCELSIGHPDCIRALLGEGRALYRLNTCMGAAADNLGTYPYRALKESTQCTSVELGTVLIGSVTAAAIIGCGRDNYTGFAAARTCVTALDSDIVQTTNCGMCLVHLAEDIALTVLYTDCATTTSAACLGRIAAPLNQFVHCSGFSIYPECNADDFPASMRSAIPIIRCLAGIGFVAASNPGTTETYTELDACFTADSIIGDVYTGWQCKGCYISLAYAIGTSLPASCKADMYSHACLDDIHLNDREGLALVEFNTCLGITNPFDRILFNNDRSNADYRCPASQFENFASKMHVSSFFNCVGTTTDRDAARTCMQTLLVNNPATGDLPLTDADSRCSTCFIDFSVSLNAEHSSTLGIATCSEFPTNEGCDITGSLGITYSEIFQQCSGHAFHYAKDQCNVAADLDPFPCTQWAPSFLGSMDDILASLVVCANSASTLVNYGTGCTDLVANLYAKQLATNALVGQTDTDYHTDASCFACFDDFMQSVKKYAASAGLTACVPATVANFDWTVSACIAALSPFIDRFVDCQGGFELVLNGMDVPTCSAAENTFFQARYEPYEFIVQSIVAITNVSPNLDVAGFFDGLFADTMVALLDNEVYPPSPFVPVTFSEAIDFLSCGQCYYNFVREVYGYHQEGLIAASCADPTAVACKTTNTDMAAALAKFEYCSGDPMITTVRTVLPAICDSELSDFDDFGPIIQCAMENVLVGTAATACLSTGFPDFDDAYATGTVSCASTFQALITDIADALDDPDHPEKLAACTYIYSDECWDAIAPQVAAFYRNLRRDDFQFVREYDWMRCESNYSEGIFTGTLGSADSRSIASKLLDCLNDITVTDKTPNGVNACLEAAFAVQELQCRGCVRYFVDAFYDVIGRSVTLAVDLILLPSRTDNEGCFDQFKDGEACPALWPVIENYQKCSGMSAFGNRQACMVEDLPVSFTDNALFLSLLSGESYEPSTNVNTAEDACSQCFNDFSDSAWTSESRSACLTTSDPPALLDPLPKICWAYLDPLFDDFEACSGQFSLYTGIGNDPESPLKTTRCTVAAFEDIMTYNDPYLALSICAFSSETDEASNEEMLDCIEEVSGSTDLRNALYTDGVYTSNIEEPGKGCPSCFLNFIAEVKAGTLPASCLFTSGDYHVLFRGDDFSPKNPSCVESNLVATALTNFYTCSGGNELLVAGSVARKCSSFEYVTDIAMPYHKLTECAELRGSTDHVYEMWDCVHRQNFVDDYMETTTTYYNECRTCFSDFLTSHQADPTDYISEEVDARNSPSNNFRMCMGYALDDSEYECRIDPLILAEGASDTSTVDDIRADFRAVLDYGGIIDCAINSSNEYDALACADSYLDFARFSHDTEFDSHCNHCFQGFAIDLMRSATRGGHSGQEDYSVCHTETFTSGAVNSSPCLSLLNEDYAPITRLYHCMGAEKASELGWQCTKLEFSTLRWLETPAIGDTHLVPEKALQCAFDNDSAVEAISCLNMAYTVDLVRDANFNVACISCFYQLMSQLIELFAEPALAGMKDHCAMYPWSGVCGDEVMWDILDNFKTCSGFAFPWTVPSGPYYCSDAQEFSPIGILEDGTLFETVAQCAVDGVILSTCIADNSIVYDFYTGLGGSGNEFTSSCLAPLESYYVAVRTLALMETNDGTYADSCGGNLYAPDCLSLLNGPLNDYLEATDAYPVVDTDTPQLDFYTGGVPHTCSVGNQESLDAFYPFAPAVLCGLLNASLKSAESIKNCIHSYAQSADINWDLYPCIDCLIWFVSDIKLSKSYGSVDGHYMVPFSSDDCSGATTLTQVYQFCLDDTAIVNALLEFTICTGGYTMYTFPPPTNPVCAELISYSNLLNAVVECDNILSGVVPTPTSSDMLDCIDAHDSIRLLPTYSSDCDICLTRLLEDYADWPFSDDLDITNGPWIKFQLCMGAANWETFTPVLTQTTCSNTIDSSLLHVQHYTQWIQVMPRGLDIGDDLNDAIGVVIAKAEHGMTTQLVSESDCLSCFEIFLKDLYFLTTNDPHSAFARACHEPYSTACRDAILANDGAADRMNFCSGSDITLTDGGSDWTGTTCSNSQVANLQAKKLPFQTIAMAVRTTNSASAAKDAFTALLTLDSITNTQIPCKLCFNFLIDSIFELSLSDRVMCAQDFTAPACTSLPVIAEALVDFTQCAGFEFPWPEASSGSVQSSVTTTRRPAEPITTTMSQDSVVHDAAVSSEENPVITQAPADSTSSKSTATFATASLLALLSMISIDY